MHFLRNEVKVNVNFQTAIGLYWYNCCSRRHLSLRNGWFRLTSQDGLEEFKGPIPGGWEDAQRRVGAGLKTRQSTPTYKSRAL
jgi:hypothetical protein